MAKAAEDGSSTSQLDAEGMVVGSRQYMRAEQATGDRVYHRSDLYSLGILLYQMLTGAPPFDGDSAQAILMKQATATPAPIARLRSDVTSALAAVVDRLLAQDPGDRFQTAEPGSHALVGGLPVAARACITAATCTRGSRSGWSSACPALGATPCSAACRCAICTRWRVVSRKRSPRTRSRGACDCGSRRANAWVDGSRRRIG